ncbi:MAG: MBL fold metallo-hydrolase RNA specificity domain-containing protein, partial [Bacteroidota bacterium]
HADRSELLLWASTISDQPKKVFITHGEPEVAKKFATTLMEKRNWNGIIPEYLETFRLFEGI